MSKTEKVLLVLIVVSGIAIAADCICQCGPRAAMRCEDGGASPERFALLDNGGSLLPQVLVMWAESPNVTRADVGFLKFATPGTITLYRRMDPAGGKVYLDPVVIRWDSIKAGWWLDRGAPFIRDAQ